MVRRGLGLGALFVALAVGATLLGPFILRALRADERQVDPILRKENLYIELKRVEGTNEAGALKVYGIIKPQKHVESSKVMVGGSVVVTGGAFDAGDFTFSVDQNSIYNQAVEVTLQIDGESNTVGFRATREQPTDEGSAWYHEVYSVQDFGLMPYRFHMSLSEQYAKMTYSIDKSGRTSLADQSRLILSDLPEGEMGEPFVSSADHVYVTGDGDLYPRAFGMAGSPVVVGPHDLYRECSTSKWITPEKYASITYGKASVLVGLETPAGPNLPCMYCLMSNNVVKAPDQ